MLSAGQVIQSASLIVIYFLMAETKAGHIVDDIKPDTKPDPQFGCKRLQTQDFLLLPVELEPPRSRIVNMFDIYDSTSASKPEGCQPDVARFYSTCFSQCLYCLLSQDSIHAYSYSPAFFHC